MSESVLRCIFVFRVIVFMNSCCNMLSIQLVETDVIRYCSYWLVQKCFGTCCASMKNILLSYIKICFGVNQHYAQAKSIIYTSIQ